MKTSALLNRAKTRNLLIALLFLISMLVVSSFSAMRIEAQTLQNVTLPSGTPLPWMLEFDGSKYIWFSGSKADGGYLVRVDTSTVLINPTGSVQWWKVTVGTNPEGSSYAGANVGVTIGGGYIWSGGVYSGADWYSDLLSRFNPSTQTVTHYWLSEVRNIRAIRYDNGIVWIAGTHWKPSISNVVGAIIKFDVASATWTWYEVQGYLYDLLVDGDYLWVTTSTPSRVVKFNKLTSSVEAEYTPSSPPTMLTKDSSGNIWFTMNNVQKVAKIVGGVITEYALGLSGDGPYGLRFDIKGKLWLATYGARSYMRFDPSTASVMATQNVASRPYYIVPGSSGVLWSWAQGSVDLFQITPQATTTTTTTTISTANPHALPLSQTLYEIANTNAYYMVGSLTSGANPIDWSAAGFLYGRVNTRGGLINDLDPRFDQNGQPLAPGYYVGIGGPGVNRFVNYYEAVRFSTAYYYVDGSVVGFKRTLDNSPIFSVQLSSIGASRDYFIIQVFRPSYGAYPVLTLYGLGGYGTLAGGLWFAEKYGEVVGFMGNGGYSNSWYIYEWVDGNGDNLPQISEIMLVGTGN